VTDPREPDSVFVAFQILTSESPEQWDVRVVKSIDRGDTFTLGGGELNPDPVTPADDVRAARGPQLRNGVFIDYFAAEDGWHYLVYEDEGLVYFTRAQPIDPVPGFPPLDGLAWIEPVRVSIPDSPSLGVRNVQPAVAGLGSRVVVTYYEQSLAGNDASTYVVARVSDDQGDTWRTTTMSRNDAGDTLMFEPCTLQNRPTESYFGDYIDVQPLSLPTLPDTGFFVTWTDSRVPPGETGDSCAESTSLNAVHHHTYGATVR